MAESNATANRALLDAPSAAFAAGGGHKKTGPEGPVFLN
jgi:hypothetical protein